MIPRCVLATPAGLLGAFLLAGVPADGRADECLPGGGGRLEMHIHGQFDAELDWDNEGTVCEGGPRPAGDALRLMFSREDEGLLVVLGITGLERGATADRLRANLTIVREGRGEFYGSLGDDACTVSVQHNAALPGLPDAFHVAGRGRCDAPIEAVARDGEIRVAPFVFAGLAHWPEEAD